VKPFDTAEAKLYRMVRLRAVQGADWKERRVNEGWFTKRYMRLAELLDRRYGCDANS